MTQACEVLTRQQVYDYLVSERVPVPDITCEALCTDIPCAKDIAVIYCDTLCM